MFAKHFEDEKHQFITKFNYLDQVTLDFLYLPSNTTELFPLNREQARELQEGFWKSKPDSALRPWLLWMEGGLNMHTLTLTLLDLGFSETLKEGLLLSS